MIYMLMLMWAPQGVWAEAGTAFEFQGGRLEVHHMDLVFDPETAVIHTEIFFVNRGEAALAGASFEIAYQADGKRFAAKLDQEMALPPGGKHKAVISLEPAKKGPYPLLMPVFGGSYPVARAISMKSITLANGQLISDFHTESFNLETRTKDLYHLGEQGLKDPVFTRKVAPRYPVKAIKRRMNAGITVSAILKADGTIECRALPLEKDRFGFGKEAEDAVRRWEFEPGRVDGKAVDVQAFISVDFFLQ